MPLYQSISAPVLGNRRITGFWVDYWLGDDALCYKMPALFSHARLPLASVAMVVECGLRAALVTRLTVVGEREFAALSPILDAVRLTNVEDCRRLTRCAKKAGALDVGTLYRLHQFGGVEAPFVAFVCEGFTPSKAKFFAWLLVHSRIQSRAALLKKKILSAEEALCPICNAPLETVNHIIFGCSLAARFWTHLSAQFPPDADFRGLHGYAPPVGVSAPVSSTFIILCCWNLWRHRNGCAFRGDRPSLPRLLAMCNDDAALWRHRVSSRLQCETDNWAIILRSPG
ncbi:unnamed protein product [Alopecurus aequalis]